MIAMHDNTLNKMLCVIVCGALITSCQAGLRSSGRQASPELEEFNKINETVEHGSYDADAFYYFSSAQLVLKAGQIEEAIWLLEKAVTLDMNSLFLKVELAETYTANRQFDKALTLVDMVLSRQTENVAALLLAGKSTNSATITRRL